MAYRPLRAGAALSLAFVLFGQAPAFAQAPAAPAAQQEKPEEKPEEEPPFDSYSDFAIRVDELKRGPDKNWQAVASVKNLSGRGQRVGASHFVLLLTNAARETIKSYGNIYRASVTGSIPELDHLVELVDVGPGEVIKIRLIFPGSGKFAPVSFRLSNAYESKFKDHAMSELEKKTPAK